MKISLIGPGLLPIPPQGWGAVEILMWDYYEELLKLGHDIQIVNTTDLNRAISEVNEFDPDFAHLHYDCYWQIFPYLNCKNKAATTHYSYLERLEYYGPYWSIMNGFLSGDFRVFCLSPGIRDMYIKLGCDPNRLAVTPNGVRIDLFNFTETPKYPDRTAYLGKIAHRKRQYIYQELEDIDFIGNREDPKFNYDRENYKGEWNKPTLYNELTNYSNLALISDGEAHALVCVEALGAGLGLVVSEYSTANLDLTKPFISVIPENKVNDIEYVSQVIKQNREISNTMRTEIRQYAKDNFDWKDLVRKYVELI